MAATPHARHLPRGPLMRGDPKTSDGRLGPTGAQSLSASKPAACRRPRPSSSPTGSPRPAPWWRTHGLPPQSGPCPPTRRPAHRRDRRCRRARLPRRAGDALGRPKSSACRSSRLARATTASTGTFQRDDNGRVWYVARENGNRRALPLAKFRRRTARAKPATGNFRSPTLVFSCRASCEKRVRPSFCLRPRGERGSADGTQRSQDDSDRHCGRGAGAAGVHGACLPVMRASTREEMRRISSTSRSSSRLFSIHSR